MRCTPYPRRMSSAAGPAVVDDDDSGRGEVRIFEALPVPVELLG